MWFHYQLICYASAVIIKQGRQSILAVTQQQCSAKSIATCKLTLKLKDTIRHMSIHTYTHWSLLWKRKNIEEKYNGTLHVTSQQLHLRRTQTDAHPLHYGHFCCNKFITALLACKLRWQRWSNGEATGLSERLANEVCIPLLQRHTVPFRWSGSAPGRSSAWRPDEQSMCPPANVLCLSVCRRG